MYHNPTQPSQAEKDDLGICEAKKRARDRWLRQVVHVNCSKYRPEVRQACLDLTQSTGWQQELDREFLVHDISVKTVLLNCPVCHSNESPQISPPSVRQKLAEKVLILFLHLKTNYDSKDAQTILGSDQDELLEGLKHGLQIPVPPRRTKRDQSQVTSLLRILLQLSSGKLDPLQGNINRDYTASENRDLCALVFGITSTNDLGEIHAMEMWRTLSKSPVFSRTAISVPDLERWTAEIKDSLQIGFCKGYLVGCPTTGHAYTNEYRIFRRKC